FFGANVTFDFCRDGPAIDSGQRDRVPIKRLAVGGCYAADRLEASEKLLQHLTLGCSDTCDSFRDDSDKSAALAARKNRVDFLGIRSAGRGSNSSGGRARKPLVLGIYVWFFAR